MDERFDKELEEYRRQIQKLIDAYEGISDEKVLEITKKAMDEIKAEKEEKEKKKE